jgi:regulation of enolase protein 1 (concanavalin A-like superfamily)
MAGSTLRVLSIAIYILLATLPGRTQTNPSAQALPYTQDFSGLAHSSTTYPAGWQGWQLSASGASGSFRITAPTANLALFASSSASSNTGGVHNYNGKIGLIQSGGSDPAIVVVINTTSISNVQIAYDIMTIRNPYDGGSNIRINETTLQYRVGITGNFTSLTGIEYQNNTTTQTGTGVTTPQNLQTKTITLPAACNNQAVVQLRWVARDVSGGGGRPSFAVDNFSAMALPPPPDYSITTTGNAIVINDNTGNGETIAMTESGGNLRFIVTPTTRTYSINGGATTAFSTPADVALAGANSITINAAAGNDIIDIGAFTAALPSLTINGGTGDDGVNFNGDITFATNANLDVDLQNDNAIPGTDHVVVGSDDNLLLSGTGTATIKVSQSVTISLSGSIVTENGNLIIEANQQAITSSGNFQGIGIVGLIEASGTGSVTVLGRGGNTGNNCRGIYIVNGTGIRTSGSGTVTVVGTGGASTGNSNYGIFINNVLNGIHSSGGAVHVTGQGGGTGSSSSNFGVYLSAGSGITNSGPGNITVTGTGGGMTTGGNNYGIYIDFDSGINHSGTGSLTVSGTAGNTSGNDNKGVYVAANNALISSAGGALIVNGTGTNGAPDIQTRAGGMITSTSTTAGITLNSITHGTWPNSPDIDVSTTAPQSTAFGAGSKLNIDIDGLTLHTEYKQLTVIGGINLNDAELSFAESTYSPSGGDAFIIVDNDDSDPVTGTFNGLPEGASIPNFLGSLLTASISYMGGDGNDVVITVMPNVVCYADTDGDGFGDPANSMTFSASCGMGFVSDNNDCDDSNGDINPDTEWFLDADNDNFSTGPEIIQCASPGIGYKYAGLLGGNDCDDNDSTINPNATEICNGMDDDCDTEIDESGDVDNDGFPDCFDNCPLVANSTFRPISIDGNIADFGAAIGNDNGINYYFSADDNYFYIGVSGVNLENDNIHIAFSNADGNTTAPNWGVDFTNTPYTYLISFFSSNDICYYPYSTPYTCQQVGVANWQNYAGFGGNTTSEIRIPRIFLGSLVTGSGQVNLSIWANNNAGNFVFSTYPASNPTGPANVIWSNFGQDQYPTYLAQVDVDSDGYGAACDCDDNNDQINPGVAEICDGIDNNCDTNIDEGFILTAYYPDMDGDGYGTGSGISLCADPGTGFATSGGDCSDGNAAINPGANEICDGIDNNCDGQMDEGLTFVTYYPDMDGDGYGTGSGISLCADPGIGFATSGGDCSDGNAAINPGANEICDGIDNNCDGQMDEGLTFTTYYTDADGDGYGAGAGQSLCADPGLGFAPQDGDCDDVDPNINPGVTEICDGADNNCDGEVDEGLTFVTYYPDMDGDGYGTGSGISLCADPGTGFATSGGDCSDGNAAINPGANEICDGIDNNCNGQMDEGLTFVNYYPDMDGDGYGTGSGISLCADPGTGFATTGGDCSDGNAAINPGATEICDGVDNNCDGQMDEGLTFVNYYPDMDGDGYGTGSGISLCANPGMGFATLGGDCNDSNPDINPGETEVCDGMDNDCDMLTDEGLTFTTYYTDADGDGYGTGAGQSLCADPGLGFANQDGDCDDVDPNINPGETEICDGADNNCDGEVDEGLTFLTYYPDTDSDGYGTGDGQSLCTNPGMGFSTLGGDCNDSNPDINPGETEVCDGIDNDCDMLTDEGLTFTTYYTDADGDGYGTGAGQSLCANPGMGFSTLGGDCNDSNPETNPGATETCDGMDNDCNTLTDDGLTFTTYYADADGDGYGTGVGQSLCEDPGLGFATLSGDCDDEDPAINPGASEICDGVDNDCDGLMDEELTFVTYYPDMDGDGFGTGSGISLCANPGMGFATLGGDCNDSNPDINPGETEVCDGMDNDCDMLTDEGLTFTTYYTDADGDGYGTGVGQSLCADPGAGFATQAGDCADGNPDVNPGEEEICGNEIDDNCNLQIDEECCDLLINNTSSTAPSCPGGSNGAITISASSSSGPINYTISGPVNQNNQTGLFTGLPAGLYSISVSDAAMCSLSSSITVTTGMDTTPPTVMCSNQTINFNGESSIPLNSNELASYSDNCGIQSITLTPNSISSSQAGQTVPVLVTVTDNSGNTSTCTSQVTANGLPPGWSSTNNGVGCADGNDIEYNPSTQVWTATSTNCYYSSPFTSDETAFAQRTLCGNGSITAEVTGITGTSLGWAGLVLRESNSPGAKKVQIMTNLSNLHRREVRTVTNGPAAPQQFPSNNRHWLRLVRTGNQIVAYSSPNGINWFQVLVVNVPMNSCIQMGLVVTNYSQNSTVVATFDNVSYTGSGPAPSYTLPNDEMLATNEKYQPDFNVYPNPTSGELNLDMREYIGKNVQIELYSLEGKLMQLIRLDEVQQNVQTMLLDRYTGGMYFVKLKSAGLPDVTKRVVLTKG